MDYFKDRRAIEKEMETEVLNRGLAVNFAVGSYYDTAYKKPVSNTLAKLWFVLDFVAKTQQITAFEDILTDDNYKNNLAIALDITFDDVETLISDIIDKQAEDCGITRYTGQKAKFYVYLTRNALSVGDSLVFNQGDLVWTLPVSGVVYRFLATSSVTMSGAEAQFYEALADSISDSLNFLGITDPYVIRMEVEAEAVGTAYNVGSYSIIRMSNTDFQNIFNIEGPSQEGEDEETDFDLLERIKARRATSEVGSALGYRSQIFSVPGVIDMKSQGFTDPLMQRDVFSGTHLGAKADLYILGIVLKKYIETHQVEKLSYLGSTPDDILLDEQPVSSVVSVIGPSSGELFENDSWVLAKDYSVDREGSTIAQDVIHFLKSILDFSDILVTRNSQIGITDPVPLGLLVSMLSIYRTPEVLAATPFWTDGTFVIGCSPYPLFYLYPWLASTPEFYSVSRVENVTQGINYDLTDIEFGDNQIILASTPNVSNPAPLTSDVVEIDYLWKQTMPETFWDITLGEIDWAPGDAIGYGPDIYGATSAPPLSSDYYANYTGEAPLKDEILTIEYRVNDLVAQAQDSIDTIRPVTDDVQVRESILEPADMELDIVSDGTYSDDELKLIVAAAITTFMARLKLGQSVDQSDIVSVVADIKPDFAKTYLTQAVSVDSESLPVQSTVDFDEDTIVYIDEEAILFKAKKTQSFYNLTRGVSGTIPSEHSSGALVTNYKNQISASKNGVEKVSTLPFTVFKRRYATVFEINSELVAVGYVSGNTAYDLVRGYRGTTPAVHGAGSTVKVATKISQNYISAIETSELQLVSCVRMPDSGVVTIGTEKIFYSYRDAFKIYDLTRGYGATTPDEHFQEDEVSISTTLASTLAVDATQALLTDGSGFIQGKQFSTLDATAQEYLRAGTITLNVVE